MNDELFDDMALEHLAKQYFGLTIDIDQVIVRQIMVSRTTRATVFLTNKKQLFVYVSGQSRTVLGDVKKIVSRMGLVPEIFFPPKNKPDYFDTIGREKFKTVFPGRDNPSDDDIMFYRTLAPYNPAMVLVSEVKDGHIYCYDSDSKGSWRSATKFAYRRIKTS